MSKDNRANLVGVIREGLGGRHETDYVLRYLTHMANGMKVRVLLRGDIELLRLLVEHKEDLEVYVENGGSSTPKINVGGSSSRVEHDNIDHNIPSHSMSSQDDQYDEDDEDVEDEEDKEVHASEDEEEDRCKELLESLSVEFLAWVCQPAQMDRIMSRQNFSSDHQSGSSSEHHRSMRNWIIPFPNPQSIDTLGWIEQPPPVIGELVLGSTFRSKEELRITLRMYHFKNMLECITDRSADDRIVFICKSERKKCQFRLCAVEGATIWRINKLTLDHSCQIDLNRMSSRSVTSEVVAHYFANRLTGAGVILKPNDMIAEMRREFGINMLYHFVLRMRNITIEKTYDDFDKLYQRLPSFLYFLKQRNSGTIYDLQTTREGLFCHMFVTLGQSIRAFDTCLRPVIIVDGTHLKGMNKGILFVATTLDGNEQVFSLAVGLGPIETNESWTCFLYNLRRCYNPTEDLLIVSDQHRSIQNVVRAVYPNAFHGLCFHHLTKNLTSYGAHAIGFFRTVAYAHREELFENYFSKLHVESPNGAHRRLSEIGPARWTRSMCPVRRYNFLTSNAVEWFNNSMLWARRLPICSLLEIFRQILETWFNEKRAEAASRDHELKK